MNPAVTNTAAPPAARISQEIPGSYFHDCYEMPLEHEDCSALAIYLKVVARTPRWVESLMTLRNRVVSLLGLKNLGHLGALPPLKEASAYRVGDRVGIFTLLSLTDDEVILGDADKHLDVKVSVCRLMCQARESIAVTTVVHIHNLLGRVYMFFITPMHRLIVPAVMRRASPAYHDD